jgi:hypothetical protein
MMLGETGGLKGRAQGRAGEPVAALDPLVLTQRRAVMPFRAGWVRRRGCHVYFARRVTFQPCADIAARKLVPAIAALPSGGGGEHGRYLISCFQISKKSTHCPEFGFVIFTATFGNCVFDKDHSVIMLYAAAHGR